MFGQMLVMRLFRENKILTQICGNNLMVLKAAPPLMVSEAQLDEFVRAVKSVVETIHSSSGFSLDALSCPASGKRVAAYRQIKCAHIHRTGLINNANCQCGNGFSPKFIPAGCDYRKTSGALECASSRPETLSRLHTRCGVSSRNLVLPLEAYDNVQSWGHANDLWIEAAQTLGRDAICRAITPAGLTPGEIDALYFVSVTGVASPSIDARLVNRMGLSPRIKRVPMFGLGCVAGAVGLARAADYVRGFLSRWQWCWLLNCARLHGSATMSPLPT